MDPVTITSLVLGIAPLIISAVENYEVTFQPFVIYRRYSREIDRFTTRLDAQKAIFNNQCQLLLLAAERDGMKENVILDSILQNPNHPARRNEELNIRLKELLGASAKTCISTLRLIQDTLDEITRETKGFKELSEKKPGERTRFHHFKSKIKISFSKTRLHDIVDELKSYNDDLRVLSNQVSAVSVERKSKPLPPSTLIYDLQISQQASQKVHSLLATKWVCGSQVDHAVNLSLDVQLPQYYCASPGVRFSLSMTCISQQTSSMRDAVWLNIESSFKELDTTGESVRPGAMQDMLNLTSAIEDLGSVSGPSHSGPFSVPRSPVIPGKSQPTRTPDAMPATAIGAGGIEKLCSYFHSQLQHNSAIHFETTNKFEHYVYRCPCPLESINRILSLHQILQNDADQRKRKAWASKFKLARLLTLGVLRFQSTPWVRETLNSSDIHFLVNEAQAPEEQKSSLEDPYISIQLSRETSIRNRLLAENSKAHQLPQNELLFNLGVILLELGYDAPLRYLQSAEDVRDGDADSSWYTDFFTARRLGKLAPRELDARYGRIAKKCLDCDFGVGDDLGSLELQSAVLRDVVNELDRCIKVNGQIDSILAF